jgi:tetratricopeptide (TPR) repeat protein
MTSVPSSTGGPYGLRDIRNLYPAVTDKHLRYLEKWGLVRQSSVPRDRREYAFSDLLTIKQVAGELDRGTPLRTVLRSLLAERQGQLELDFLSGHVAQDAPRAKVVNLLPRKPIQNASTPPPLQATSTLAYPFADPQSALAAKYFLEGSRLDDGDERKMEEAAAAYRKALVVDPDLVPAIVNLANIHYARDEMIEAQALYERAIGLDPDCFEAHFNLGNILHDLGRYETALVCYRDAVELNPGYADAHFYLAVTLEKIGHSQDAKPHWKAYQDLAPKGEWAELAQEFLE